MERNEKTWVNTNKLLLLENGVKWKGLKTGITNRAGPCLSCCTDKFIIILLNSNTMDIRWEEA